MILNLHLAVCLKYYDNNIKDYSFGIISSIDLKFDLLDDINDTFLVSDISRYKYNFYEAFFKYNNRDNILKLYLKDEKYKYNFNIEKKNIKTIETDHYAWYDRSYCDPPINNMDNIRHTHMTLYHRLLENDFYEYRHFKEDNIAGKKKIQYDYYISYLTIRNSSGISNFRIKNKINQKRKLYPLHDFIINLYKMANL